MRLLFGILTPLLILIACLHMGCKDNNLLSAPLTPVRVQTVAPSEDKDSTRFTATVTPYTEVALEFKVEGYITRILQTIGADGRMRDIQPGDYVEKSMTLAQVDPSQYLAKVIEAKAQLEEARASLEKGTEDFKRAEILYSTKSITAPNYEHARKEYQVAKAQVEGARAQLADAEIKFSDCSLSPPMNGVILKRDIEIGALVRPGTRGFTIADVTSVKVLFAVPDVLLGDVSLGEEISVRTGSINKTFTGRITEIAPRANTRSRVFNVEITVPNSENELKPGMIASLELSDREGVSPIVLVPLGSVVRSKTDTSGFAVYVIKEDGGKTTAIIRDAELGSVYGNMVAVIGGIEIGDKIITNGAQQIRDGEEIRVIP